MSINLSGLSVAKQAQKRRDRMFSYSILFAFCILLITGGVYVAFNVYNKTLQTDIDKKINETNIELTKLSSKDAVRVIDAANRIDNVNKYYMANSIPFELIERVNNLLIDGVVLNEYGYEIAKDVASVEITATTNDFLSVARQVAKLKQSNDFSSVKLRDIDRDDNDNEDVNTIKFVIDLTVAVVDIAQMNINVVNPNINHMPISNSNNIENENIDTSAQVLQSDGPTTYNGLNTEKNWNPIPEN